jgi:hypothetical protein
MIGDQQVGQNISIGEGCDFKATIEHEILHALGFFHEQSRTDRDDYVNIWWDQIITGEYDSSRVGKGLLLSLWLSENICCRPRLSLGTGESVSDAGLVPEWEDG